MTSRRADDGGDGVRYSRYLGRHDRDALCASFDACAGGVTGFSLEAMAGPFLDELASDSRIADYMRRLRMVPRT